MCKSPFIIFSDVCINYILSSLYDSTPHRLCIGILFLFGMFVCFRLNSNNLGNWSVQVMDFLTRLVDWKRLTLNDEPSAYKDKIWVGVGPTSTVRLR